MTRSTIAATLAALALSAAPVAAQTPAASSTKGFFMGAHLNGSSVKVDEQGFEDEANGGGLGFQLGYGFTPQFALFIDLTAAQLEDEVGFGHFDLGARYAFTSPTRRWVPSVEAAFTSRALMQDDAELEDENGETAIVDLELLGSGFTLGFGLQYYATPSWAFGAGLKFTSGEFDSVKVDNITIDGFEIDATSTRFNLGVTWFPGARR